MGGTEKLAVGARGLLVCHSRPLTGLLHVTSSELPFFRVEKSESSVLSVLRVARKERKCSGRRLSKLTLRQWAEFTLKQPIKIRVQSNIRTNTDVKCLLYLLFWCCFLFLSVFFFLSFFLTVVSFLVCFPLCVCVRVCVRACICVRVRACVWERQTNRQTNRHKESDRKRMNVDAMTLVQNQLFFIQSVLCICVSVSIWRWVHTIAEVCNFSPKCITTRRLPLGQKRRYR